MQAASRGMSGVPCLKRDCFPASVDHAKRAPAIGSVGTVAAEFFPIVAGLPSSKPFSLLGCVRGIRALLAAVPHRGGMIAFHESWISRHRRDSGLGDAMVSYHNIIGLKSGVDPLSGIRDKMANPIQDGSVVRGSVW